MSIFFQRVWSRSRAVLSLGAIIVSTAIAACKGAIPSASSNMASGEALNEVGAVISQLREDNAQLQSEIDSLRGAVSYQDSVLHQLAVTAGVAMRPLGTPIP